MPLVEGIRRLGFRKWYERELLESHAHLALTILCALALLGALEATHLLSDWADQLVDALAVLASAVIGLWALRRYLALLMHAEHAANQADCPHCGVYARFTLVEVRPSSHDITVCCRNCSQQWSIED